MSERSPTDATGLLARPGEIAAPGRRCPLAIERLAPLALVAPALLTIFLFFLYPLGF